MAVPHTFLRHAVVVLIMRDDGALLFARRAATDTWPGYWNPITGSAEDGDAHHLAETCRREALEELGVEVVVGDQIWQSTTSRARFILHWFVARLRDPEAPFRPDPSEVGEIAWVKPEHVGGLDLAFADTRAFFARTWPTIASSLRPPAA